MNYIALTRMKRMTKANAIAGASMNYFDVNGHHGISFWYFVNRADALQKYPEAEGFEERGELTMSEYTCPSCGRVYHDNRPVCTADDCPQYWEEMGIPNNHNWGELHMNHVQLAKFKAKERELKA